MAEILTERIKKEVRTACYFTIIADETRDVSKTEHFLLSSGMFFMAAPTSVSFPLLNVEK